MKISKWIKPVPFWCCRVPFFRYPTKPNIEAQRRVCPVESVFHSYLVTQRRSLLSFPAPKMATLSSCTLLPLNSDFRFNPVRRSFRNKIHCHRLNSHVSQWGNLKHVGFDRFRCFSINNKDGVDAEGETGNNNDSKPNVTTASPDEDKSTTPSVSQMVLFFSLIHSIIIVCFCCYQCFISLLHSFKQIL